MVTCSLVYPLWATCAARKLLHPDAHLGYRNKKSFDFFFITGTSVKNYCNWQTVSFHSNFRLSLGEGFPFQMLFKIKNVWNPRSHEIFCRTFTMSGASYFFFLSLKYRAFSFTLSNEFSPATFSEGSCSVKRKASIHTALLRMGELSRDPPPWDWGSFSPNCLLMRTLSGIEFLFTTWKLSILSTFGSFTERHFKNSRFSCYHQKTSIKICICTWSHLQHMS